MASLQDLFEDPVEGQAAENAEGQMNLDTGGPRRRNLVGVYNAGWVYRLWHDGTLPELSVLPAKPDEVNSFEGSGSFLYFKNDRLEQAKLVQSKLGIKNMPGKTWRLEINLATDVLVWHADKPANEVFNRDTMAYDVPLARFGVDRFGAGLHLLTLPSMVQANLLVRGIIKEPVFDYGLLADIEKATQPWQDLYVGTDEQEGQLVTARKKLWELAGEVDDWTRWSNSGEAKPESGRLQRILSVFHEIESDPFYASVGQVTIPHIQAVSKSGKPNKAVVFYALYRSAEDAIAANAFEGEAASNGAGLPPAWAAEGEENWRKFLIQFLTKYAPKPTPGPGVVKFRDWLHSDKAATDLEAQMGVKVAEIEPWLVRVNFPSPE